MENSKSKVKKNLKKEKVSNSFKPKSLVDLIGSNFKCSYNKLIWKLHYLEAVMKMRIGKDMIQEIIQIFKEKEHKKFWTLDKKELEDYVCNKEYIQKVNDNCGMSDKICTEI